MAQFKFDNTPTDLTPDQLAVANGDYEPLYGTDVTSGGLAVLGNGNIVEIRHPYWCAEETPIYLRTSSNALRHTGSEVVLSPLHRWDAAMPTMGSENEFEVSHQNNGWYPILPDGETMQLPNGKQILARDFGFQPEALSRMLETGTKEARGLAGHRQSALQRAAEVERFLEAHDLLAPPISEDPDGFSSEDISKLPYIQLVSAHPDMYIHEFGGTMSEQLHVQMNTPSSAFAAATYYQAIQAIVSLVTQSAPARDSSLDTTLGAHYLSNPNPEYVVPPGAAELVKKYGDIVPSDWREFSRKLGSPSGGVYQYAAPFSLEEFLVYGNEQLASGRIPSLSRAMGMHTDRLRLDLATTEINNMGRSGGNHYIEFAAKELVARWVVSAQVHHAKTGEAPAPLFDPEDTPANREKACAIGRLNSFNVAAYGKKADLILPDGSGEVTPVEFLMRVIESANTYSPVSISLEATAQLLATLRPAPKASHYAGGTASDVYADFYRPQSSLTGAEAIVVAREVEPSLPLHQSLLLMARHSRAHTYKQARQHARG